MSPLSSAKSAKILDCTLRDGGYYTAWDFDKETVAIYLETVSRLPIDTVELGYCSRPRAGYYGRHYFLDARTLESAASVLRPDQTIAVMLDEKSVKPSDIGFLVSDLRPTVGVVRIAVAPTRLAQAAALGRELKRLGFDVGVNIMYLSTYWSEPTTLDSLDEVAATCDSIALVDSYGSCVPEQVSTAVRALTSRFTEISIGFHGHDNLGLAVANTLAAVTAGASIIDGTMTGMGRGPGNARSEILCVLASLERPRALDYAALEACLRPFQELQASFGWGTNLAYMASGAAGLPQAEVMEWIGKNRYSLAAIVQALHGDEVESLDKEPHPPLEGEARHVVVIGGGPSVRSQTAALAEYVRVTGATVVHANYRHLAEIPQLGANQYLCLAGDAAARLPKPHVLAELEAIVVPEGGGFKMPQVPRDTCAVVGVAPFTPMGEDVKLGPISDIAPLALALGVLDKLGAETVVLVGFDGYQLATSAEQDLARESQTLITAFVEGHPRVSLTSATPTLYDVAVESLFSRLAAAREAE